MSWVDNFDLNSTCSIKRVSYVSDGMGGNTETTSLVEKIKCAFWQNSAMESFRSGRISNPSAYTLVCKPSTKYLASDIIYINNVKYRITEPSNVLDYNDLMTINLERDG